MLWFITKMFKTLSYSDFRLMQRKPLMSIFIFLILIKTFNLKVQIFYSEDDDKSDLDSIKTELLSWSAVEGEGVHQDMVMGR